jgi:hydrogenase nickel incorporation protein HypA/HybF
MHEIAICQALISRINNLAEQHGGATLERIVLRVGPLSGAEPELLRHAFPLVAEGSVAASAALDIEMSPVEILCRHCGTKAVVSAAALSCPGCGGWQTVLLTGDELILQRLEFQPRAHH